MWSCHLRGCLETPTLYLRRMTVPRLGEFNGCLFFLKKKKKKKEFNGCQTWRLIHHTKMVHLKRGSAARQARQGIEPRTYKYKIEITNGITMKQKELQDNRTKTKRQRQRRSLAGPTNYARASSPKKANKQRNTTIENPQLKLTRS